MSKHPPSALDAEIWEEIETYFWRHEIPCLPRQLTYDGLSPETVETTKRGFEITGEAHFIGGGPVPDSSFPTVLVLRRPTFSTIESVTNLRIANSVLAHNELDDGNLILELT